MNVAENYKGKKVLVTGASGYLAWNLFKALDPIDCKIRKASRSDFAPNDNHSVWAKLIAEVDYVFHFSGQTNVKISDKNPALDFQQNVAPLVGLLQACRNTKRSPFVVFAGSVTAYGNQDSLPVNESAFDSPLSTYCLHKAIAEKYIELFCRMGWARGVTLRLANVYGPGPESTNADRGILNLMIQRALAGEPITIYGEGHELRDYIFVEDVIRAFLTVGLFQEKTSGEHFIVSSGKGTSISNAFHQVAEAIKQKVGRGVKIEHVSAPDESKVNSRNFVGDIEKITSACNWRPEISLKNGIELTIDSMTGRSV